MKDKNHRMSRVGMNASMFCLFYLTTPAYDILRSTLEDRSKVSFWGGCSAAACLLSALLKFCRCFSEANVFKLTTNKWHVEWKFEEN